VLLQSLPLVFVLSGLALYVVLGGADFGAGFWQLLARHDRHGQQVREFAHHSMGPVWEANHVWLIFVLTVFWTAYPKAFGSIASTLAAPLFIALIGILFRGAAYAWRSGATSERELGRIDTIFSLSSILTPFALGAAIGAIATNRVPVGNATGHLITSWLNATSIFLGLLAVASCAHLAAVYLAADAARERQDTLEHAFRVRALGSGCVTGLLAIAGIFILKDDRHALFDSLLTGTALIGVIVSCLAGLTTLALVYRRRYEPARYSAALAVAAIIAGWALARWPTILPGLTIHQAAAGHDTLLWLAACTLAGALILFPALALLFSLTLTGRLTGSTRPSPEAPAQSLAAVSPRALTRAAIACLTAGFLLLNVADAEWAHGVGIICLLGFVLLGFGAIVFAAIRERPPLPEQHAADAIGQPTVGVH
jgi:cytochrome bd ubiquinol oxidase subunit II